MKTHYLTVLHPLLGDEAKSNIFLSSLEKQGALIPLSFYMILDEFYSPFPRDRINKKNISNWGGILFKQNKSKEGNLLSPEHSFFKKIAQAPYLQRINGKEAPKAKLPQERFLPSPGIFLNPTLPPFNRDVTLTETPLKWEHWQLSLLQVHEYGETNEWWKNITYSTLWTVKPQKQKKS